MLEWTKIMLTVNPNPSRYEDPVFSHLYYSCPAMSDQAIYAVQVIASLWRRCMRQSLRVRRLAARGKCSSQADLALVLPQFHYYRHSSWVPTVYKSCNAFACIFCVLYLASQLKLYKLCVAGEYRD